MNTTNSIIEKIHHEASTAEQKLLIEADRILKKASNKEDVERINKLQTLGFYQFKDAVEMSPEQVRKIEYLKKLIQTYQIKAPTAKFMTDEAVHELCEKYGLIQAPVSCYIDRIPERNQKEIVDFKIDKEFLRNSLMEQVEVAQVNLSINSRNIKLNLAKGLHATKDSKIGAKALEIIQFITENWEDDFSRTNYGVNRKVGLKNQETASHQQVSKTYSDIILSALKVAIKHGEITESQLQTLSEDNVFDMFKRHYLIFDAVGRLLQQSNSDKMEFRIIAPKHMLELENYNINNKCQAIPKGYEYTAPNVKQWFEQDDPIVQVKVEGGWLNITAWGEEAEHPEVFNEQLN